MTLKANALISRDELMESMDLDRSDFKAACFSIYNSSGDAIDATVAKIGNTLTLVVTGGANAGTKNIDLTNASYDTIGELVTYINGLSKGWVANQLCSSSFTSTDLNNFAALDALQSVQEKSLYGFNGNYLDSLINAVSEFAETFCKRGLLEASYTEYIDGNDTCYLKLKNYPVNTAGITVGIYDYVAQTTTDLTEHSEYEVTHNQGMIYKPSGWSGGLKAWKVVYTAGYTAANMPEDLKQGIKDVCKYIYGLRQKAGLSSESDGVRQTNFQKTQYRVLGVMLPLDVIAFLNSYRKLDC